MATLLSYCQKTGLAYWIIRRVCFAQQPGWAHSTFAGRVNRLRRLDCAEALPNQNGVIESSYCTFVGAVLLKR